MGCKKYDQSKVIGFYTVFGKVNAIVVKEGRVELQEIDLKDLIAVAKIRTTFFLNKAMFKSLNPIA